MDSPTSQLYRPLRAEETEIRLLSILPVDKDGLLHCTLEHISLDSNPSFEAISYVWGDETKTREIDCNGHRLNITVSLHGILSRLELSNAKRMVWADALCINQGDDGEKASQVPLMARIYRECLLCRVWLGEVEDEFFAFVEPRTNPAVVEEYVAKVMSTREQDVSITVKPFERLDAGQSERLDSDSDTDLNLDEGLAVLTYFTEDTHFASIPWFRSVDGSETAHEICPHWHRGLLSLLHVIKRPYWKRVWTLQECVLPRTTTVHFGDRRVDLLTLTQAARNLIGHLNSPCCELDYTVAFMSVGAGKFETCIHRLSLLGTLHDTVHGAVANAFDASMHWTLARNRECKMAHDMVYGMAGIWSDLLQPDSKVDHGAPAGECFARATHNLRKSFRDLSFLMDISVSVMSVGDDTISRPSWAIPYTDGRQILATTPEFSAAGRYMLWDPPHDHHWAELPVEAIVLTSVLQASQTTQWQYDIKESAIEAMDAFSADVNQQLSRLGEVLSIFGAEDSSTRHRVWKVLFSDYLTKYETRTGLDDHDLTLLDDFHDFTRRTEEQAEFDWRPGPRDGYRSMTLKDFEDILGQVLVNCAHDYSVFFTTKWDLFGKGNRLICDGDTIAILKGCTQPVVLRPIAEDKLVQSAAAQQPETPRYRFVSCCYLEDVMYGEVFDDEVNEGDLVWTRMVLV